MKIGFTGTQNGMTSAQRQTLFYLLSNEKGEFHHGDCIGADSDAHDIAESRGLEPIIHPPDIMRKRAFKKANQIRHTKPYLDRNKDIVNETETWSTIRYARKLKKKITIIYPNGSYIIE